MRAPLGACALVLLLLSAGADGKGGATGSRGSGSRARVGSGAFRRTPLLIGAGVVAGGALGYGMYRAHNRDYSPSYGGDWYGGDGNGTCGACECPIPREDKTRVWVWVQARARAPMCATLDDNHPTNCNGNNVDSNSGTTGRVDVTSFEVDAFKEIGGRASCRAPTQVLALRLCTAPSAAPLDDAALLNPSVCQVVGEETSVHLQARLRRLLQASSGNYVIQFVVGASSEAHGDGLHGAIRDAISPTSKLGQVYSLDGALLIETENDGEQESTWMTGVIIACVIGGCSAACFAVAYFVIRRSQQQKNEAWQPPPTYPNSYQPSNTNPIDNNFAGPPHGRATPPYGGPHSGVGGPHCDAAPGPGHGWGRMNNSTPPRSTPPRTPTAQPVMAVPVAMPVAMPANPDHLQK